MDEFARAIFRDQSFADAEQLAFAERLDGACTRAPEPRDREESLRQRALSTSQISTPTARS